MAVAPLIIAGIGLGVSAVGTWKQGTAAKKAGQAQRRVAESQAELLDFNAHVADLQAADAITRGREEEARFRSSASILAGTQIADTAAAGVLVGTGSAADVQVDAKKLLELDALTIQNNAAREAWGLTKQAEDLRRRAEITRREGVNAEAAGRAQQTAARTAAVGGLLTGSGSLLLQRYGQPSTTTPIPPSPAGR